jgi:hypothetical protein
VWKSKARELEWTPKAGVWQFAIPSEQIPFQK